MVLPFILGAAALGAAAFGVTQGSEAAANNSEAERLRHNARMVYESAEADLKKVRTETVEALERLGKLKLEFWEQLGRFVKLYEQIRNIELQGQPDTHEFEQASTLGMDELAQMKNFSSKAHELILGGAGALGTAALVGIASNGGAWALASAVGTASTGTAIGSLSGAAAVNATLAWLGGGSLAAGGMGMAGGMAILGGITFAPVLAVGGWMINAQSHGNLANAQKNKAEAEKAAEEMKKATSVLNAINEVAKKLDEVIRRLSTAFTPVLDGLEATIAVAGTNYAQYNESQKRQGYLAVQFAQILALLLKTSLMTEQGTLDENCTKALQQAQLLLEPA